MDKFKAFRIREAGGKTEAGFTDCTLDELDPGDVVVRVSHSTINYKDALAATGKGRILQRPECIGGVDLAGTVVSSISTSGLAMGPDWVSSTTLFPFSGPRSNRYGGFAVASANS